MRLPLCLLMAGLLTACSAQPGSTVRKADTPAWQGVAGNQAYTAQGWKPGDAASWEKQMTNRAQAQNEYSRTSATP